MADAAFVVWYRNGQVIAETRGLSVSAHARHMNITTSCPVKKDGGARQTYVRRWRKVGRALKSRVGGPLSNSRINTAERLAGNEDLTAQGKKRSSLLRFYRPTRNLWNL